jgi:hypothetical protein
MKVRLAFATTLLTAALQVIQPPSAAVADKNLTSTILSACPTMEDGNLNPNKSYSTTELKKCTKEQLISLISAIQSTPMSHYFQPIRSNSLEFGSYVVKPSLLGRIAAIGVVAKFGAHTTLASGVVDALAVPLISTLGQRRIYELNDAPDNQSGWEKAALGFCRTFAVLKFGYGIGGSNSVDSSSTGNKDTHLAIGTGLQGIPYILNCPVETQTFSATTNLTNQPPAQHN